MSAPENGARAQVERERDEALAALDAVERERDALLETMERIKDQQPSTLATLIRHDIVFDGPLGNDPKNWQHVAFTIYNDLCKVDLLAALALDELAEGRWLP